jgi:hypothetical protein
MATVTQQVDELRNSLTEKSNLTEWMEDTWSETLNAERMALLTLHEAEDMLNLDWGKKHGGFVTLTFVPESIDLFLWSVGQVWGKLKDLEERTSVRLNAIVRADNASTDPRDKAAVKAKPATVDRAAAVTDAMEDLENDVFRLRQAATIAAQLVDAVHLHKNPGGDWQATISKSDMETLTFAVAEAEERAAKFDASFQAALKAGQSDPQIEAELKRRGL